MEDIERDFERYEDRAPCTYLMDKYGLGFWELLSIYNKFCEKRHKNGDCKLNSRERQCLSLMELDKAYLTMELAVMNGMSRANTYNILEQLVAKRYIERSQKSKDGCTWIKIRDPFDVQTSYDNEYDDTLEEDDEFEVDIY